MRIWLVLLIAFVAGCGSGGSGNSIGSGAGTEPVATRAAVKISTLAASAETTIYGVEFVLNLPEGVTVSADPATGAVQLDVLSLANSGAFAGARYLPATAGSQGSVTVVIADAGGFTVGELATLTCSFAPGLTVTPAGFSLQRFIAKNQNGAEMTGISPHFTVQKQ